MNTPPDLVGLYITDDTIEVVCGFDPHAGVVHSRDLKVVFSPKAVFEVPVPHHSMATPENVRLLFDHIAVRVRQIVPKIRAIGVGCYGPFVSLKSGEPGFGRLQVTTHGRFFSEVNVAEQIAKSFSVPADKIIFEPDVVCAALGEAHNRFTTDGKWRADAQSEVVAFLKISHGIGGAVCRATDPYRGRLHSEMGQIYVRKWHDPVRDPLDDETLFEGVMPYPHRLEALASVWAIEERYAEKFAVLRGLPDHPAWHREAWYLSQLCIAVTMISVPSRLILGGRIMGVEGLIDKVRAQFAEMIGNPPFPMYDDLMRDDFIDRDSTFAEGESDHPGLLGALLLAAVRTRPGGSLTNLASHWRNP